MHEDTSPPVSPARRLLSLVIKGGIIVGGLYMARAVFRDYQKTSRSANLLATRFHVARTTPWETANPRYQAYVAREAEAVGDQD